MPIYHGRHTVQVVSKNYGKLKLHKHIGTFTTKEEKQKLLKEAREYIDSQTGQQDLFAPPEYLQLKNVKITQSQPLLLYRLLSRVYNILGFNKCSDLLIKNLIIARVYQPSSKRGTQEVLYDLFGVKYSLITIYRHLKTAIDNSLKEQFQSALISFAQKGLNDSLRLIFYDATTLAFDSQAKAGLKDFGFSKNWRFTDVQIVIGLVVNRDGFPLYFDVFNGKTFEGKTFISVIDNIRSILKNPDLIVVADAAMLSRINIEELDRRKIGFIVGARLANLPVHLQDKISGAISRQDQKITTVDYLNHRLICQYLTKRAAKDKSDREKQIEKARNIILAPAKISRRYRFLGIVNGKYILNSKLINKAEKLEGIKGYLTNTTLDEKIVIERYYDLWRVEKAFRITKSDLEARPVFLRLDKTITCHLVIVFAGLAICRYLEIKSNMSIHKILKIVQKVLTHKVINVQTGESALIETTIEDLALKEKIEFLNSLGH